MIGFIKGKVVHADGQEIIVLTSSGVGYEIFQTDFFELHAEAELFISEIVRETENTLYGFKKVQDKKIFELLLTANGVGPKSAFSLITHLGSAGVIDAITLEETTLLTKAQGIGKKGASQIILSLKDKVKNLSTSDSSGPLLNKKASSPFLEEALLALTSLGYKEVNVLPVLKKNANLTSSAEELIKLSLKEI